MNCWRVLGIGPTVDRAVVKRAYARRLKHHNPEVDPEGFMRLRAAYETALSQIAWRASLPKSTEVPGSDLEWRSPFDTGEQANPATPAGDPAMGSIVPFPGQSVKPETNPRPRVSDIPRELDRLYRRMEEVYAMGLVPDAVEAWSTFLEDDAFWNLDLKNAFAEMSFPFLLDHRRLPVPVWKMLAEFFPWLEEERRLTQMHGSRAKGVFRLLRNPQKWSLEMVKPFERSTTRADGSRNWAGRFWFLYFFIGLSSLISMVKSCTEPTWRANGAPIHGQTVRFLEETPPDSLARDLHRLMMLDFPQASRDSTGFAGLETR